MNPLGVTKLIMKSVPIFLLLWVNISFGQTANTSGCIPSTDTLTQRKVYLVADTQPTVEGGMDKLYSEMSKSLKLPPNFHPTQTRVIIAFIVDDTGALTGMRTLKNIEGTDLSKQFIETVSRLKWEPGSCQGTKIPVLLMLPLVIDFN